MDAKRSELKRQYKMTPPPMGVYRIRNLENGKVMIGSAMNLPGILNSNRFQLKMGSHPNKELLAEWKFLGEEKFVFEVLDELDPKDEAPDHDYRADLAALEELWIEREQPFGVRGYHLKGTK